METYQIRHTTLDVLLIADNSQDQPQGYGQAAPIRGAGAGWKRGSGESAREIELGYQVVLAQASARRLESLALQGVDTKTCGCSAAEAATAALGAVHSFLKTNPGTSLRRILLMQYSQEGYEAFCGELKKLAIELSASSGA